MEDCYVVILNFRTGKVDALSLNKMNPADDAEEYITETLGYDLKDCEWMVTHHLGINFI